MKTWAHVALGHALLNIDLKNRQTERDIQAKLTRKPSANVMADCKNNPPRRGFLSWLAS